MDTGIGNKVGLELSDIHIDGSIKPQRRCQGRYDLGYQPVEVRVGRPLDIKGSAADIIDGFVIQEDSNIGVFE